MSGAGTTVDMLDRLKRDRPEWTAWLVLLEIPLREAAETAWDATVPVPRKGSDRDPLLQGTTIRIPAPSVHRLWHRLIEAASRSDSAELRTLGAAAGHNGDTGALFAGSLRQAAESQENRVDVDALHSVIALVAIPFLHACRRRWATAVREDWTEGYCPICGAWPSFAEVRGIERTRVLRCGRCGSAWRGQVLRCPYCATTDHEELVTLVPEGGAGRISVEACRRCEGYIKTIRTLQGCAPDVVMLEDLANVDLDLAVLDHGFHRPFGAGYPLHVSVEERGPGQDSARAR